MRGSAFFDGRWLIFFVTCAVVNAGDRASAADLIAGQFYDVGDGVVQTLTLAGNGSGDYENATIGATIEIGLNGGQGTVNVLSGATLTVHENNNGWRSAYIGDSAGASGELVVSGAGSRAIFGDSVAVGYDEGSGEVSVLAGGRIESGPVQVSGAWDDLPTPGSVSIAGAGSSWINSGITVGIGGNSNGILDISARGTMQTTEDAYLAFGTGAGGSATVSGFDALWMIGDELTVGGYGDGQLSVLERGRVGAGTGYLAAHPGSVSEIVIDGFDAVLEVQNDFSVGGIHHPNFTAPGGDGTLTVRDNGEARIGGTLKIWPSGTVDVQAGGSVWANRIERMPGGTLLTPFASAVYVNDLVGFGSSFAFGHDLSLGHSGGTSQESIGVGQSLQVGHALTIGEDQNSVAVLSVSGAVSAPLIILGLFDEAHGTVNVSGPSATLDATMELSVGYNGVSTLGEITRGTLNITDGALVKAAEAHVGRYGGSGEVTVDDATLQVAGDLFVGSGNLGSLTIRNGGAVESGAAVLGDGIDAFGEATLTGAGSRWMVTDTLAVGGRGSGTLHVDAGAHIDAGVLSVGGTFDADASSEVVVSDADTALLLRSLSVRTNGRVTIDDGASIDALIASVSGELTLDGATMTVADSQAGGPMIVRGDLTILGGSVLTSQRGEAGLFGEAANVVIEGTGSRWTTLADDLFLIGGLASGRIDIREGGTFQHGGDLFLGVADAPTSADLSVAGQESRLDVVGNLYLSGGVVNDEAQDVSAAGHLVIGPGARVSVGQSVAPFTGGVVSLTGGRLEAAAVDLTYGGTFQFTGGELAVGQVVGDLVNDGGVLSPGQSTGVTVITGDYTQAEGSLLIEIGGTAQGEFDRVEVGGVASLGGILEVNLIDLQGGTYMPSPGDTFGILFATGGYAGMFDELRLPMLDEGLEWRLNPGGATVFLEVVSDSLTGDFNSDGNVDAADYVVWRRGLGTIYTPEHYALWRTNFGATTAARANVALESTPEPGALALILTTLIARIARRGRRRCKRQIC